MIGAIIAGSLSAPTAPVTNSWESIESFTVGSGGTTSITFGSGGTIPQTYKHLQIRYTSTGTSTGNEIIRFNGDTGSNYSWHVMYGNGAGSALAAAGSSTAFTYLGNINTSAPNAGIVDLLDYTNTSKYKTMRALCGTDTNGAGEIGLFSGVWQSTSAITSVTISFSNIAQYSSFALYGIKG